MKWFHYVCILTCLSLFPVLPTQAWAQRVPATDKLSEATRAALPMLSEQIASTKVQASPDPMGIVTFETPPESQVPFVSISLDGGKPQLFLVDPGVANCLLDKDFVKSEHLPVQKIKSDLNDEVEAVVPDQSEIQGPLPFVVNKIPFGLSDLSQLRNALGDRPPVVGVLGANFLRAFVDKIDFSQKKITFFARDTFILSGKKVHRLSLQKEMNFYYLQANVDGKSVRFKFRFGSRDTVLQDALLLSSLHPLAKLDNSVITGHGGQALRLRSFSVENVNWDDPIVTHLEDPAEKENIIGLDFLSRFLVTLDLSAKQLYLEPNPNYKEDATKWIKTGFYAVSSSDGKITVAALSTPSPASEAGLKIGDEILEINGKPVVDSASFETIYSAIKHVVGTIVRLKIRRKDEDNPRELSLTMRKLL